MTAQDMTPLRPGLIQRDPAAAARVPREERLPVLYAKWEQFVKEYDAALQRNDQEVMTNLRGLMLLIKREIKRLGGDPPAFPYSSEHHLADL